MARRRTGWDTYAIYPTSEILLRVILEVGYNALGSVTLWWVTQVQLDFFVMIVASSCAYIYYVVSLVS